MCQDAMWPSPGLLSYMSWYKNYFKIFGHRPRKIEREETEDVHWTTEGILTRIKIYTTFFVLSSVMLLMLYSNITKHVMTSLNLTPCLCLYSSSSGSIQSPSLLRKTLVATGSSGLLVHLSGKKRKLFKDIALSF